MNSMLTEMQIDIWLEHYIEIYNDVLLNDPDFSRWLNEEYVPIAGGWQY